MRQREIVKMTMKEKIQQLIEQKISEWQDDDIYAISLYVYDAEDDPRRPVAILGYNTERQVQKSIPEASGEQEARWNYAFWLQNVEMCLGQGDTAEDIKEWITEQDLWDNEDEITPRFTELLVAIVQGIHASGLLKDKFGREIPILIHELEYYEQIARQNIEANGEALDKDFVSFCIPCIPEVQDELRASQNGMPRVEKRITVPQSQVIHGDSAIAKKSTDMRKVAAYIITIILTMSLFWVLGLILSNHNKEASEGTSQQTENFTEKSEELQTSAPVEDEEETSMSSNPKEAESNQIHWQVYIQPDMPEAFKEVLKQFEEFFNVFIQDQSFENAWEKVDLTDSEWGYMFEELCGGWYSRLTYDGEETAEKYLRYSLTDLTGDDFPELIMGYFLADNDKTYTQAVFYYNESEGIKMRYVTVYDVMALYEDGIIEYISSGFNYTVDYAQFQDDSKEWIRIDSFLVETVIDGEDVPDGANYYRQEDGGDFVYGDLAYAQIPEEEYTRITDSYIQRPVEMEWTSLILASEPVIMETECV